MTIYSAGTGPYQFQTPFAGSVSYTTSGSYDTAWVSSCLYIGNTSNTADFIPWTPFTEGWVHFEASYVGRAWARSLVNLKNNAGTVVLRLTAGEAIQYWNGSAWTTIGSVPIASGRHQFDLYTKIHATEGEVKVYYNKELIGGFEGDTTGMVNIAGGYYQNPISFGSDSLYVSQILVTDFPTLFAKVKQTVLTQDGTYTAWTGSVLDIDDAVPSQTTFIKTDTIGAKESFKAPARDFTGYAVQGVVTSFTGLRGGLGAPTQGKMFFRINGADYDGTAHNLKFGSNAFQDIHEVNPATGVAWTPADAGSANLELGIQALSGT